MSKYVWSTTSLLVLILCLYLITHNFDLIQLFSEGNVLQCKSIIKRPSKVTCSVFTPLHWSVNLSEL